MTREYYKPFVHDKRTLRCDTTTKQRPKHTFTLSPLSCLIFQSPEDVQISQLHLKLLDSALKMEARNYSGPYLPKERRYRTIPRNRQVERVAKTLMEPLSHIVGDSGHVSEGVVLSQLPLHPLYCADIMIYPSVAASMLRCGSHWLDLHYPPLYRGAPKVVAPVHFKMESSDKLNG